MSEIEPVKAVEADKPRFDWPKLVAGGLAGISLIGAFVANFNSGGASRSAGRAIDAEERTAVHAAKVSEAITITEEMMERARTRASDMERRIGVLEKEVADLEEGKAARIPHEKLQP